MKIGIKNKRDERRTGESEGRGKEEMKEKKRRKERWKK